MNRYDIKNLKNEARGRWDKILSEHGIGHEFLNNKNGPCPLCGGTDRWRWDNKNNDGGGYCHQCDLKGTGIVILAKWLSLDGRENFRKMLEILANSLSSSHHSMNDSNHVDLEQKKRYTLQIAHKIWNESNKLYLNNKCPANLYFIKRGLKVPTEISTIKIHPSLSYYENGHCIGKFPAIVSLVASADGEFLGIHRTYLSFDGSKAPVSQVKMVLGSISCGSIHLDENLRQTLHLSEGLETALAIREIINEPVWSAISAGNLAKVEIPSKVKKVHIWADLDCSGAGEIKAHELARKLYHTGVEVIIHLPEVTIPEGAKSIDWLDVLIQETTKEGVSND